MIADENEKSPRPGQEALEADRTSPMPGVTVYEGRCSGRVPVCPPCFGAVLCVVGRLRLSGKDERVVTAGPGELLLLTRPSRAGDLSVDLAPAVFWAVEVERDKVRAAMGTHLPPPFDEPSDVLRLKQRMDAQSGYLVLRDPDWSSSVLSGLRRLPQERRGDYVLLRLMERLCLLCGEPLPPSGGAGASYYDLYQREAVKRVHDYILANLDQNAAIETLARRFQMSPTYLKEGFRNVYGMPLHAYVQQQRLEWAAHLLATTTESVLSVASRVGYSGTSRFNAAFKARYHMTPSQYRHLTGGKMSEKRDDRPKEEEN